MAHIGFTPQSVNSLGGFRVQGRGDAAEQTVARRDRGRRGRGVLRRDGDGAGRIGHPDHRQADHPDHRDRRRPELRRAGAGLAGHGRDERRQDRPFVKRFADVGAELRRAAQQYAEEVAGGVFPAEEHSF